MPLYSCQQISEQFAVHNDPLISCYAKQSAAIVSALSNKLQGINYNGNYYFIPLEDRQNYKMKAHSGVNIHCFLYMLLEFTMQLGSGENK
jgi:hypothetical protein